jgi:hypothetical protein
MASSLTACSSESVDMTTADLGKRWELRRASDACNSKIEKKRWGSVSALLAYEKQAPDHGYRNCMESKLN